MTESLTLKDLKTNLKDALRKSGAVNTVKASLRREFISNLRNQNGNSKSNNNSKVFNDASLRERIMLSTLYHSLKSRGMSHSLSVFVAECGMESGSALTEIDIVQGLNFGTSSDIYTLTHEYNKEKENSSSSNIHSSKFDSSILDLLVDQCCKKLQTPSAETSAQTESGGQTASDILEMQSRELNKRYQKILDKEKLTPQSTFQERMLAYQQECDERMRKDIDSRIRHFRESEAVKIRLDEQNKSRIAMDGVRKEMQIEYERRLLSASEREAEANRNYAEKERALETSQYEYRQRMEREIDTLRMREAAAAKKAEMDIAGVALMDQRLREEKLRLEGREREMSLKEQELQTRAREAGDAAREEATNALREQTEAVARERAALQIERDNLEDSKSAHLELINGGKEMKQRIKEAEDLAANRQEELDSAMRQVKRLEAAYREDEAEYAAIAAATGGLTRPQHLLKLVRQNAELQAKVTTQAQSLQDVQMEVKRLEAAEGLLKRKELDLNKLNEEVILLRREHNEEMRVVQTEVETLKRTVRSERARSQARQNRIEELQALLQEQRNVTARLGRVQNTGINGDNVMSNTSRRGLTAHEIETVFRAAARVESTNTALASVSASAPAPPVSMPVEPVPTPRTAPVPIMSSQPSRSYTNEMETSSLRDVVRGELGVEMNQMRRSLEGLHEFVHSLSNMRYSADSANSRQSVDSLDLDSYRPAISQSSHSDGNIPTPSQHFPSPQSTPLPSKNKGSMEIGMSKTEQKADLAVRAAQQRAAAQAAETQRLTEELHHMELEAQKARDAYSLAQTEAQAKAQADQAASDAELKAARNAAAEAELRAQHEADEREKERERRKVEIDRLEAIQAEEERIAANLAKEKADKEAADIKAKADAEAKETARIEATVAAAKAKEEAEQAAKEKQAEDERQYNIRETEEEEAKRKQEEDDKAHVQSMREKVRARRRQKAARDAAVAETTIETATVTSSNTNTSVNQSRRLQDDTDMDIETNSISSFNDDTSGWL